MAATPPPAPAQEDGELLVRSSASPSIPPPPPLNSKGHNTLLHEQIPPPPSSIRVPGHLLHGGAGRAAISGSEEREMVTNAVGTMGGQEDMEGGDPQMGMDGSVDPQLGMGGSGRKRQQRKNLVAEGKQCKRTNSKVVSGQVKVVESEIYTEKTKIEQPKQRLKKRSNRKSASPCSPMQVVSSPGVNIVMSRSAASRRASFRRVKMEGLPKTSHQLLETSQQLPDTSQQSAETSQQPHVTPSPDTRTNSHALQRRRRKLISAIWKEAVPIYSGRRLVQGRCIHCQQVFAADRDIGTSHIKRHLKDVERYNGLHLLGQWFPVPVVIAEGREMCCSPRGSFILHLSDLLVVHELNSSVLLCHHHIAQRAENTK